MTVQFHHCIAWHYINMIQNGFNLFLFWGLSSNPEVIFWLPNNLVLQLCIIKIPKKIELKEFLNWTICTIWYCWILHLIKLWPTNVDNDDLSATNDLEGYFWNTPTKEPNLNHRINTTLNNQMICFSAPVGVLESKF